LGLSEVAPARARNGVLERDPWRFGGASMNAGGKPLGFNIIGHCTANVGLGVAARSLAAAIRSRGHPVAALDVRAGARSGHDRSLDDVMVERGADLPYSINVCVFSALAAPEAFIDFPFLDDPGCLNVGNFWWELAYLPPLFSLGLAQFDVLLAGSDFLRACFESQVPLTHVVPTPHRIDMPADIQAARRRFGIAEQDFAMVTIVEPQSDPERKNPFSAILAFQRAFGQQNDCQLIVRINNAQAFGERDPSLAKLQRASREDPRIRLSTEPMKYSDVLSLYASCDAFVSLHRSEGLGLGMLEAMLLGKPVIATAYSGNMSFMNHVGGCLVRYRLVPVRGTVAAYTTMIAGGGAHWAEPDIEDAALWMARLKGDRSFAASVGAAGRAAALEYQGRAQRAMFVDELLAIEQRRRLGLAPARRDRGMALQSIRQELWLRGLPRWRRSASRAKAWLLARGQTELDAPK
jgi:glycosyltransferase involved in cell wall biosynthesis